MRDLKRNLLVFNCDIFSFCSVPIYLCLIEVEYVFHGERKSVRGYLNFLDLISGKGPKTISLRHEGVYMHLTFRLNIGETIKNSKYFAMSNMGMTLMFMNAPPEQPVRLQPAASSIFPPMEPP